MEVGQLVHIDFPCLFLCSTKHVKMEACLGWLWQGLHCWRTAKLWPRHVDTQKVWSTIPLPHP